MKKNFDAKVRGIDLAIDYAHESDQIAAGWIKGLELSNGNTELWAIVEWTPQGRKRLSDKEFRYLSADCSFDYEDNERGEKHGPTLLGAALTNRPVVKGMRPAVELTERKESDQMKKTMEQLQQEVKTLTESQDAAKKTLGEMTAEQAVAKIAELETAKTALEASVTELKTKVETFEQAAKLAEKKGSVRQAPFRRQGRRSPARTLHVGRHGQVRGRVPAK
jgi:phage I-like protein